MQTDAIYLFYHHAFDTVWLAWLVYWSVAAIGTKPVRRRESTGSRLRHIVPLCAGVALMVPPHAWHGWLAARLLPATVLWFFVGLILTILGLGFSVLARVWLGADWSGTVTLKQDHELIRGGPYRWVRHPIYTGILLAMAGSAIALGEWRGLVALALFTAAFRYKTTVEERFLTEQFGDAYTSYQRDVPALVPGWR